MRPTNRDLKILEHIGISGVATANDLLIYFDNSKKSSRCHYRRISILKREKYLDHLLGHGNKIIGYILTKKAIEVLKKNNSDYAYEIVRKDHYKGKYDHDIFLSKIKHILLKSPLINNFITDKAIAKRFNENKLKLYRDFDKIPDGLFNLNIEKSTEKVALEVEINQKNKNRYNNILKTHLLTKNWETVYYIVKDKKMGSMILDNIKELRGRDFNVKLSPNINDIYICPIDEFLKNELDAIFYNDKWEFSLRDLEK